MKATMKSFIPLVMLAVAGLWTVTGHGAEPGVRVIDEFDDVAGWKKIEAPGTKIEISQNEGVKGQSLCLAYDLGSKDSFVVAVREIAPEHPNKGRFSFHLKTADQDVNLEFKLVDVSGNTFMKKWTEPATHNQWRRISIRASDIAFAWAADGSTGPAMELGEFKQVELGITGTGKGVLGIDQLLLESGETAGPAK